MGRGGRAGGPAPEPASPPASQLLLLVHHGSKLKMLHSAAITVSQLKLHLSEEFGVPAAEQRLVYGAQDLDRDEAELKTLGLHDYDALHLMVRCLGGKGGFGAMLRGQASRPGMKKVESNTGAMRDLSGRRLRHVEQEHKLAEWEAEEQKRKLDREEAKKAKRQKFSAQLHDVAEKYLAEAVVSTDHVEDAVKHGLLEEKKQKEKAAAEEAQKKKEAEQKARKLDKIWGMGDEDDSSEEEGEPAKSSASKPVAQPATAKPSNPPAPSASAAAAPSAPSAPSPPSAPSAAAAEPKPGAKLDLPPPSTQGANGASSSAPQVPLKLEDIDLLRVKDLGELEAMGGDRLKYALQQRGLKCGGTPQQRAERLMSIKGLSKDKWPANLLAPQPKK